ncbi:MAG: ABC transporter permease [Vicinamibacteria bacterium]
METLVRDVRFAVRSLLRQPGFSAVALLTLALGTGANAAVFSAVHGALLAGLPFPGAERLVYVFGTSPKRGIPQDVTSVPNFRDWQEGTRSFSAMAGVDSMTRNLTGDGEPVALDAAIVTSEFFDVMGVRPALGRAFAPGEDDGETEDVLLLGHPLWQQRFGGDPRVVGRSVTLNDRPVVVVGVMPEGFAFPSGAQIWLPAAWNRQNREARGALFLTVVARLRPGVAIETARDDLATVAARLESEYPRSNTGWSATAVSMQAQTAADYRGALLVLQGAVLFVLLVACANVANLLLARGAARRQEIAVRVALGAGRGRLLRQLLTESLLLAASGGALGLLVGSWSLRALRLVSPVEFPAWVKLEMSGPVLAYSLATATAAGLLFGLAPALHSAREALAGSRLTGDAGGRRSQRAFVVAQVALAFALLAGAGLLLRTFERLIRQSPGFDAKSVATASLALPATRYPPSARPAFVERAIERAAALPGIEAAAVVSTLPLGGIYNDTGIRIEGEPEPPPEERKLTGLDGVTAGYFRALGIPLLRGRDLARGDARASGAAVVVNQAFVERNLPGRDPLGRRFRAGSLEFEIVGVAGNVRRAGLRSDERPHCYYPYELRPTGFVSLVARTRGDASRVAGELREAIRSVDPQLPVRTAEPLSLLVDRAATLPRFSALLLGAFAALSVLLAGLGLYGVLAHGVLRRTREIGLRMALGARAGDVVRLFAREGLALAGVGLGLGLLLALGLARLLRPLLFGVGPHDPATLSAVALLLAAVAAAASVLPARRAALVDPSSALRQD